jgi:para-aminobenzoate synthetase/4-amino-4-deoxychorismate lyase
MNDSPIFALLDDASPDAGPPSRSRLYRDYAGMLACHTIEEWPALLARLQDALKSGLYAVPVLDYELGEQLLGIVPPASSPLPAQLPTQALAQVLLFRGYELLSHDEVTAWLDERAAGHGPAGIADVRNNVDEAAFTRAIGRIRDYIAAGDTYQVNYTYRIRFDAFGDVAALYARLRERQPVPYGALIGLPDGRAVLSLSPELFVRNDAGRLLARPMKGTAPASGDQALDAVRSSALAADPKNRAENLMIVDLLRNDLGRIARTGSVGVPALFEVRRYSSVLQMTSTVQAQMADGIGLDRIFEALYPCGSITGAPKRRTMEIIHELEPAPRGIYTGALGWMDPPAPGAQSGAQLGAQLGDFCLSVPIRTLVLQPAHEGVRHGELGVGAGIVHDSDASAEYAECRLKARFLTELPNAFEIFETIYATREEGCRHLERHLARLRASSAYFGYPFTEELARAGAIAACAVLPANTPHRLRLALQPDGEVVVHTAPLAPLVEPVEVLLSDEPVDSSALFARHKTSIRSRYDAAWKAAERVGAFDTLFFNERDELAEGGRSSVFVRVGGRWYTPPLSSGVLPGVMRALLLEDQAWNAIECPISRETLLRAQEIVVCNALRGPLRASIRRAA